MTGWLQTLPGQSFASRVERIRTLVPPRFQHCPYFNLNQDYERPFQLVEQFERRARVRLPEIYADASGNTLHRGDRVKVSTGHFGQIESMRMGLVWLIFDEDRYTYGFNPQDLTLVRTNRGDLEYEALLIERDRLIRESADAPSNGWIETGRVTGRNFRQAWWRGNYENGRKTIYIGSTRSPEYQRARAAQKARAELRKVDRKIRTYSADKEIRRQASEN